MYNDNLSMAKPATTEPDFQRVLNALRDQVSRGEELAKLTNGIAMSLKPTNMNGKQSEQAPKQDGIIGLLFEEINRLKIVNDYSELNYQHLREIIGS